MIKDEEEVVEACGERVPMGEGVDGVRKVMLSESTEPGKGIRSEVVGDEAMAYRW